VHPDSDANRRFRGILLAILAVGIILRIVYVLLVTQHDSSLYDATYYELQAESILDGKGFFTDPFPLMEDPDGREPAADHPPLTVLTLLPAASAADPERSALLMRFTMVAVGGISIALLGLLGRALAGDAVGLLAAGVGAVDPNLWMNDGLIMSESLAVALTLGVLLVVYRLCRGAPGWPLALGAGALVGVATLARGELGLYLPLLVWPALVVGRGWRRAVVPAVLAGSACAAVLAPWVGFNLARFAEPTTISANVGLALRSSNCDSVYYDDRKLGWADVFPPCSAARAGRDQSVWDAELRADGVRYLREHLDRWPVVAAARLGRSWQVFRVAQTAELTSREGRPTWASWSGAVTTWVVVPLAVAGAFALRRRAVPVWPLVVPVVATSMVLLLALGGLPRYRAPAEPGLIVLAAAALVALAARRAAPAGPDDRSESEPQPAHLAG
jgi:4-amino-4-deoxy-L-arabinose transferase-like glycosyltransferase